MADLGEFVKVDVVNGVVILDAAYAHEMGKAALKLEIPLLQIIKAAAAASDNKIDDTIVALIEQALG